jgi:Holliday junction resolvasome RuvABC ATP-dependent DNA helicase subunit
MAAELLDRINNSEKSLGFLFTKRDNTHLLELCDYIDSNDMDQLRKAEILDIDSRCAEDSEVIINNKRLVYQAIKSWVKHNGALFLPMTRLGIVKELLSIDNAYELADKSTNHEIVQVQAQALMKDGDLDAQDLQTITLTITHLLIAPQEMQPYWASAAGPHYNDWVNNIDKQEVTLDQAQKVSRYGMLLALCMLDTDTGNVEHFYKTVNQRLQRKGEDLNPFFLWLGFKSFTGRPIYWWVDCKIGKEKASGTDFNYCRLYIFGGFIITNSHGSAPLIQPDEIKDLKPGLDAVKDERYISFKIKGERQPYQIASIENKEDYDFLYSFLSGIPIPGTTELDRMIVADDALTDDPSSGDFPNPDMSASNESSNTPPPKPASSENANNSGSKTTNKNTDESDPFKALEELVGIAEVKEQIRSLTNLIKVQQMRKKQGMQTVQVSLHSVFTGAPGTGKTTVARLYAGILKDLGILKKGHLVEVDRTELVAGYLGQTAMKTEGIINKAMDGVLFIDEAYSLAPQNSEDSYGEEAINVLLKRMEDDRDRFVVIVAGYREEMHEFIDSNPGLSSRFARYIEFPNYSDADLLEIFKRICAKNEYYLGDGMDDALRQNFALVLSSADRKFGNARYARNLFEKLLEIQSNRVAAMKNPNSTDISTLEAQDLALYQP